MDLWILCVHCQLSIIHYTAWIIGLVMMLFTISLYLRITMYKKYLLFFTDKNTKLWNMTVLEQMSSRRKSRGQYVRIDRITETFFNIANIRWLISPISLFLDEITREKKRKLSSLRLRYFAAKRRRSSPFRPEITIIIVFSLWNKEDLIFSLFRPCAAKYR